MGSHGSPPATGYPRSERPQPRWGGTAPASNLIAGDLHPSVWRDRLVEVRGRLISPCPFLFSLVDGWGLWVPQEWGQASRRPGAGPHPGACGRQGERDIMKELVRSAFQWLADTRLARRVVDTLFRSKARRRIVELDRQSLARCQSRTLLGLVHKGHSTRFGRDHDFRRIRNAEDFQRLVPLRTPAALWREYWQPAYPNLAGATWPGPIPYLAISAATSNVPLPYIPVSPDLWATHQTAALTALAFVLHARPRTRLCTGRLCLVGGGTMLSPAGDPAESLEAVAFRRLSPYLHPYALTYPAPTDRDNGQADNKPLVD